MSNHFSLEWNYWQLHLVLKNKYNSHSNTVKMQINHWLSNINLSLCPNIIFRIISLVSFSLSVLFACCGIKSNVSKFSTFLCWWECTCLGSLQRWSNLGISHNLYMFFRYFQSPLLIWNYFHDNPLGFWLFIISNSTSTSYFTVYAVQSFYFFGNLVSLICLKPIWTI